MQETEEIWKPIPGYEGLYEVSTKGRVKKLERVTVRKNGRKYHKKERILKSWTNYKGYLCVNIYSNEGKQKYATIHRLVAKAFIPNPDNKPQVNHKDEVKTNNCVENLDWMTAKENNNYGTRIERITKAIDKDTRKAICEAARKVNSKPVTQYSKDEKFIKVWSSIAEAGRQLGFSHSSISKAARGAQKQAYGYIWKYVKNNNQINMLEDC